MEDYGSRLKPTDRTLPIANISKIMKKPIPRDAKVAKDAKEIMQKSASEFIAIITCRAKEICESEARKTITGEDLIRAMDELDMPYYAELSRKYYVQYRELAKSERVRKYSPREFGYGQM
ncbi:histone H3/H4-like protein [Ordospora colligata]|uniref:Histone H3/H4-like protein n=1 Tax=Ordospora colligata OC4 TaxID=1354746 RepID=A0A0B2UJS5_9MICR|nr:histone H3/H4-like protein [Ordospora colligata OC4]KHN69613.1 histone H3/H4-like protein [Ordospora colligata OC4]TBU15732.1 histone H3/H4-like protein [Ordospora colligata]TBU15860.1 histone H3/H4-like protein [Ordospora colligata]TBU18754.1 histone H3/H4-like protein [Ordospora colligata]